MTEWEAEEAYLRETLKDKVSVERLEELIAFHKKAHEDPNFITLETLLACWGD